MTVVATVGSGAPGLGGRCMLRPQLLDQPPSLPLPRLILVAGGEKTASQCNNPAHTSLDSHKDPSLGFPPKLLPGFSWAPFKITTQR